jgi:uncharacterized LabA/DUF88 family protein
MGYKLHQKTVVLVDVQNLFYSARNLYNSKIDYAKLLENLTNLHDISRVLAYVVQRPDVSQTGFLDALLSFGYDVRIKEGRARVDSQNEPRASYEVMLTIDAMEFSAKADNIILVTGDNQYAPLVRHLRSKGCRVEVMYVDGSLGRELSSVADVLSPIEEAWMFPMAAVAAPTPTPPEEDVGNAGNAENINENVDVNENVEEEAQPTSNASSMGIFSSNRK